MKTIVNFIKSIKAISWIIIALSIPVYFIISPHATTLYGTFIIMFRYWLIAIVTEVCSNRVIKNSDSKICKFLSSTKVISRILVYFFIMLTLSGLMPGVEASSILIGVCYCLIPAVLIEWRKNGYIRSCRCDKKVKTTGTESKEPVEVA